MQVTLFGAAAGEVTGSAHLVESGKSKVLIDFGMFQGVPNVDQKNRISERFTFRNLDAVLGYHDSIELLNDFNVLDGSPAHGSMAAGCLRL